MYFRFQEREMKKKIQTIDHWRQSNHYPSTRTTTCVRRNGYVSKETVDRQIWPLGGVTRVT